MFKNTIRSNLNVKKKHENNILYFIKKCHQI